MNVLVTSKHPQAAVADHGAGGEGTAPRAWESGSGQAATRAAEPDVVMACCRRNAHAGNAGSSHDSAATTMPELKIRVVNVVDLMKLQSALQHPHGLSDTDYDALFTEG